MKISKKNQHVLKRMLFSFAKNEGIVSSIASNALQCLTANKLESLSEFELSFLYDALYLNLNQDVDLNEELFKAYEIVEQSWAIKAKMNGMSLPQDYQRKTLH
jgi:hypothetical protein